MATKPICRCLVIGGIDGAVSVGRRLKLAEHRPRLLERGGAVIHQHGGGAVAGTMSEVTLEPTPRWLVCKRCPVDLDSQVVTDGRKLAVAIGPHSRAALLNGWDEPTMILATQADAIAAFETRTSLIAAASIEQALVRLKRDGDSESADMPMCDFMEFCSLISFDDVWEFDRKRAGADDLQARAHADK